MIAHYNKSPAVREIDGASDVFKALKAAGVRVALDTGFDRRIANAVLRRMRWIALGLVDVTVTSDEVIDGRPAPDMIFRAMTLAGVGSAEDAAKSAIRRPTCTKARTPAAPWSPASRAARMVRATNSPPCRIRISSPLFAIFLYIVGIQRGRHVRAL